MRSSANFAQKRRALDSNQRIPYDIGSLANCWFKPLTQPSLNHLFVKEWCKYTTIFLFCKIFDHDFKEIGWFLTIVL